MRHLDMRPVPVKESQGVRTGPITKHQRRKVSKLLSDMRFVMKYITKLVEEEGAMTDTITPSSVWRMFDSITHRLSPASLDESNKWVSFVRVLRGNHVVVQNSTV